MKFDEFNHQYLKDGSDIYWSDISDTESVFISIILWTGSINDPDSKEGLAHLFEHMPFEGTVRYPSNLDIMSPIENLGGIANAFTSLNHTVFFLEVPAADIDLGWQTLFELVFRPLLRKKDLKKEKLVIQKEITMIERENSRQDEKRSQSILYGENIGRKSWIIGQRKTLDNIKHQDIIDFHQKYYLSGPMTMMIFGNLTHLKRNLAEHIENKLSEISPSIRRTERPLYVAQVGQLPAEWTSQKVPTNSPILYLKGPLHHDNVTSNEAMSNRNLHLTAIIHDILTGKPSTSVLPQELREKHGLIYCIASHGELNDQNLGDWFIHTVLEKRADAQKVTRIITDVITRPETFCDEQIEIAKSSLLGRLARETGNLIDLFKWQLQHLVGERHLVSKTEWVKRICEADPAEVREFVKKFYFPDKWINLTYLPKK